MTDRDVRRLDRGEWALVGALALAGLGLATGSRVLVAAATLPLWYVAAAVFGTRPAPSIRVRRQLVVGDAFEPPVTDEAGTAGRESDAIAGDPGDTVTVRTTVENVGPEPLVDLRIVDGVPDALPVSSGSPRRCVTLDPGAETTLEYAVELRRGEHAFEDATVRMRDLTGTIAETGTELVTGDDALRCSSAVERVPLGGGTNDYAGEVPTDEGGGGTEFYAVREYASGDPVRSIDWRRYASTRELATVEYRAERATRIVCVVDARSSQHRAATAQLPAAELSASAAERTLDTLHGAGHPTGVVTLHNRFLRAVSTGTDPETRRRATDLLQAVRKSESADGVRARTLTSDPIATLPRTLPGEAQVYLFSSFVDDEPLELVERLRTLGYAVRVVAPDVADADDVATRLESLDRDTRLARARALGARVVDWPLDRRLGIVLHDAIGEVGGR
ncbi:MULTISPECIES: DUF58 domain-containing protein [Natrialbaceae]|uniref:DUF58 domain-containing protein n=1 Tax=Natrialbaceae TaxID=1644061 RepID=UPI00207CA78C|nr:DUF58 domain-containing protein [Natronococcus sp. CG52]